MKVFAQGRKATKKVRNRICSTGFYVHIAQYVTQPLFQNHPTLMYTSNHPTLMYTSNVYSASSFVVATSTL